MEDKEDIRIKLIFEDEKEPCFEDVTSLFYDYELLYDFSLVLYVKDYDDYRFSNYFLYRNRGIKNEHKLRVTRIIKESPLTVELIVSYVVVTSGAIWVLIQALEKISNWRLNREKLKLEIEKLKRESKLDIQKEKINEIELQNKLEAKEAIRIYKILLKRLEKNPIKIKSMDFLVNGHNNEMDNEVNK
jgi:hypothetical protein